MAPGDYRIMAAGAYGGDAIERACWPLFLRSDFPSYETFWQEKVVRVTTRPTGMGFKSDAELAKIGCGPEDMSGSLTRPSGLPAWAPACSQMATRESALRA